MTKKLFSMLALLCLTAAGAWAQTVQVKEFTVPSTWEDNETAVTVADLPNDFVAVSDEVAAEITIPNVPSEEREHLIYGISEQKLKIIIMYEGKYAGNSEVTKKQIYKYANNNGDKIYYTAASNEVPLTEVEAGKQWTLAMPAGNVTLEPEYYPQAALTAAPTAINDVPATTDGAIVSAGTVATIGSTTTAQGTVMYYVSQTALDDAALLALDADAWTADVPTAESLNEGTAYVYYYVRGNDGDTDETTFSDGDILAANALTVTIAAAPTYAVTFADGTAEPDKWTAEPNTGVKKGQTVTVTYTGSKKVLGVKAEKKSASAPLDNTTTAWSAGTFTVPEGGLTYSDAITVSGDVTLTLTDGETLTLNKGISLAEGATLTIQGNGTMAINGTSGSTASTVAGTGTLVLTSGTLTATGGNGGGGWAFNSAAGGAAINGTVIVDGGTLTAKGGNGGNVGDMRYGGAGGAAISGSVIVDGGTLTATGGNGGNVGNFSDGCQGGAGGAAIGGSLTINAGTVTTTNGAAGSVGVSTEDCSGGAAGKAVAGAITDNR